jgi:hypothetical protein
MLLALEQPIQRLGAVADDYDAISDVVLRKRAQSQSLVVRVVFDEQNDL